jgi:uncharacterized protein (DUF2147 family)
MKLKSISAATIVALGASSAVPLHAEWSSDPSAPLVIADRDNEQVQPKWAPTSDGGFYISWFDNADGGYDVYLQRIDASGNELWPHNGVLVADRDVSSTEDYGLGVDADDNAYLAYGDQIPEGFSVVVQKVDATGATQWGDGITLSNGDSHAPHLDVLANGNVAVAWSADSGAVAQTLDPSGNLIWADGGVSVADGAFGPSDVHGDPDSNVIVSMATSLFIASHVLSAQKLAAADGAPLWGDDPVAVEDGTDGTLQFGNYPPFIADGAGGAVFVWYTVGASGEVHAQHVLADGTLAFPQNGVLVSTDTSRNHFEPAGAYDPDSGDIYALWRETDLQTQGQIGIYAQRVDASGALQWGDEGEELVALSTTDQTQPNALAVPGGGAIFAWVSADLAPMPVHSTRLDVDGTALWSTDVSTENTGTGRLTSAWSTDGYAAFAWESSVEDFSADIHAQNVNLDGTLGVEAPDDTIFEDGFDPPM